jgi:hypothetical protein
MDTQDMCRCYKQHEEELAPLRPKLDTAKKDQLKELLSAQSKHDKS